MAFLFFVVVLQLVLVWLKRTFPRRFQEGTLLLLWLYNCTRSSRCVGTRTG